MKRQAFTSLLVAVVLAVPLSLFAEFRTDPRTDAPAHTTAEEALVAAMNRVRAANSLPPLRVNVMLVLAADDRMHDLFAKHYFAHVSPDGMQPFVWADRRGYNYRTIGENLATGYPVPDAVVDGWMHSPGHRANILNRDFDEVGVAIAEGSPVRNYGGPTVVALYGAR